jgi:asparaginyl-tRNA synthetase
MTQEASAPQPPIISIERAGEYVDQSITLQGWLYNLRESGKLIFPVFRDGTGVIQGVVSLKDQPAAFEALHGLTQESTVRVTGIVRAEARAAGGFELHITAIDVLQRVSTSEPFPIQLKEHGVDFLLDKRHSVDSHAPPGGDPAHPRPGRACRSKLHGQPRLHPHRRSDIYPGGVRRHHHAL